MRALKRLRAKTVKYAKDLLIVTMGLCIAADGRDRVIALFLPKIRSKMGCLLSVATRIAAYFHLGSSFQIPFGKRIVTGVLTEALLGSSRDLGYG